AGFIGSNLIREMISDYRIICLDRLTYAGNPRNLHGLTDTLHIPPGYDKPERDGGLKMTPLSKIPEDDLVFVLGNVSDQQLLSRILKSVDGVIHLAAETHVDRSYLDPGPFIENDFLGTYNLLEAIRRTKRVLRMVHVSTDEIYGTAAVNQKFVEDDPINPTNPYSVSKAAADRLVATYNRSYGLETIIVRPSNNYGPNQHIEKLIPFFITCGMKGLPLFLYGDGKNVRSWIYVEDCCRAIRIVYEKGKSGGVYNIPGFEERENREIATQLCKLLKIDDTRIEYVKDRPGHDQRYSLNGGLILKELGFKPTTNLKVGLEKTVRWYIENEGLWRELWDEDFNGYVKEWYGGLGASSFKKS
ncbi:MAG TPA: dTDP-glucose 4,6-dehydratase, partial [bacterium (Candidatus Stahlbacteria)]|nr:dTDP-glucose 4,6-dehydratase [Candidatus Stahlbacteria bacterium]